MTAGRLVFYFFIISCICIYITYAVSPSTPPQHNAPPPPRLRHALSPATHFVHHRLRLFICHWPHCSACEQRRLSLSNGVVGRKKKRASSGARVRRMVGSSYLLTASMSS